MTLKSTAFALHLRRFPKRRGSLDVIPATHFVGFRGDEYISAVRIWGKPNFFHRVWDRRAVRDIDPADTVIFAKGTEHDEPCQFNGQDIVE